MNKYHDKEKWKREEEWNKFQELQGLQVTQGKHRSRKVSFVYPDKNYKGNDNLNLEIKLLSQDFKI